MVVVVPVAKPVNDVFEGPTGSPFALNLGTTRGALAT